MKIVEQTAVRFYPACDDEWIREAKFIERVGRIAYKSEDKIGDETWRPFIRMIVERGHEAVLEFGNMIVLLLTDRGITHEIVRHRLCSFVQESTRYCNYGKDKFGKEISFIKPSDIYDLSGWEQSCENAEFQYLRMVENGVPPQAARSVLPNSLKTEIAVKANFREWRHIFRLRAISKAAHPDMRKLMIPLYEQCRKALPEVFEMGDPE